MSKGFLNNPAGPRNNFGYQISNLQLLGMIAAGVAPPGGLATEATALNILSAIQNGQEFEQNIVIDLGGAGCPNNCPTYLMVRIWNTVTHTFDPPVYYDASGAVVVPIGPVELVNPQFVLNNILTQVTAINADLDVALSTRASELTLLATNVLLTTIQTNTANLDVALSTRASEATLLLALTELIAINAGIPAALGQTTMAASMPVVIASDQTAIPTIPSGGGAQVITSTTEVANGSVAAGAKAVSFRTSAAFTGTINGVTRLLSNQYVFEATPGYTLPAIAYTITAGSIDIDKIV